MQKLISSLTISFLFSLTLLAETPSTFICPADAICLAPPAQCPSVAEYCSFDKPAPVPAGCPTPICAPAQPTEPSPVCPNFCKDPNAAPVPGCPAIGICANEPTTPTEPPLVCPPMTCDPNAPAPTGPIDRRCPVNICAAPTPTTPEWPTTPAPGDPAGPISPEPTDPIPPPVGPPSGNPPAHIRVSLVCSNSTGTLNYSEKRPLIASPQNGELTRDGIWRRNVAVENPFLRRDILGRERDYFNRGTVKRNTLSAVFKLEKIISDNQINKQVAVWRVILNPGPEGWELKGADGQSLHLLWEYLLCTEVYATSYPR